MQKWTLQSVTIALICFSLAVSSVGLAAIENSSDLHKQRALQDEQLEKEWGIEILSMRLTAGDYMLDFRYKVLDREKAQRLFDKGAKTFLVDQASGARFLVPNMPKIGPLRSANMPKEGKNYFMLFANPGQFVKTGNLVTVEVGDFKAMNLRVD